MVNKPKKPRATKGTLFKENYFPTQVYFKDLRAVKRLNEDIKTDIYAAKRQDRKGIVRSNVKVTGSWHSVDDLHRRQAYQKLVAKIMESARQVFANMSYAENSEPYCENMWAIVNPRGGFNRYHTHPNALWSGVYYVQAPSDCGKIYFIDPRPQAGMVPARYGETATNNRESWREVYFEGIEGRLLLFPAWLAHEVEPNMSKLRGRAGDRISIAFNIGQRITAPAS